MAGYSGYSKSNNAVQAEREGKFTASRLAQRVRRYFRGVTTADIKTALNPCEYHHTSCKYNAIDYYSLLALAELETRQALRNAIRQRPIEAREKIAREARHQAEMAEFRAQAIAEFGSLDAYWKAHGRSYAHLAAEAAYAELAGQSTAVNQSNVGLPEEF